jgi:hypothetical protein
MMKDSTFFDWFMDWVIPSKKTFEHTLDTEFKKICCNYRIFGPLKSLFITGNKKWKPASQVNQLITKHYLKNWTVSDAQVECEVNVWQTKFVEIAPYLIPNIDFWNFRSSDMSRYGVDLLQKLHSILFIFSQCAKFSFLLEISASDCRTDGDTEVSLFAKLLNFDFQTVKWVCKWAILCWIMFSTTKRYVWW